MDIIDEKNKLEYDKSTLWSWKLSFVIGVLIGIFAFIMIYGYKILDVRYEDWLYTEWYDLSQHHVGWKLYRASGWHFPIGLCDNSAYPYFTSMVYTDSIPLVSLFFKILSPILPNNFQFFGLYGMFCFAMQGGIAKLLLRKIFNKEWQCNIGCIPFILSAPLLQRMYYHTALGSHYLILLAIMLYMYRGNIKNSKNRVLLWTLLGMLCISIHFTIYGMVSVMFLGYVILEILDSSKGIKNCSKIFLKYMCPYLIATITVLYIFGGFYGSLETGAWGLGYFSANLNSLYNPLGYSKLLIELSHGDGQYEGLAYVGILTIVFACFALKNLKNNWKFFWENYRNFVIAIIIVNIILWIIALSPRIMLGRYIRINVPWPKFITDLWSMFRSSGRFMWPIMYFTILLSMYFAKRQLGCNFELLFVILAIFQILEYGDKIKSLNEQYNTEKKAYFEASILEDYDLSKIKHIQFMHPYILEECYNDETRGQIIGYTLQALKNNMTVSNFHFSRADTNAIKLEIDKSDKKLREGKPDKDTIYVMVKDEFFESNLISQYSGVNYIYTKNEVIAIPIVTEDNIY